MTDTTISTLFAIVSDAEADTVHRVDAAGLILRRVATSRDHEDAVDFLRWVSDQDVADGLRLRALRILREFESPKAKPDDLDAEWKRGRLARDIAKGRRRAGLSLDADDLAILAEIDAEEKDKEHPASHPAVTEAMAKAGSLAEALRVGREAQAKIDAETEDKS